MELDLSLGERDLSKASYQNASINNNKDDHGLVFCMALGLGNQESEKPHQTYDHNNDDDHRFHQLDLLPLSPVPRHTGSLLPANVACSNSSRQVGLVLQPAVVEEEEVVVEAERASSKASTDEDENSRKKLRLSKEQSAYLENDFSIHSTLNPKQKLALANQLNLTPRQVEVWFQNRRARSKLKQTEVDCEYLKRFCDSLTEENRKLQKEIQELRALNSSNPLCMQLPATTLTMCPSCERVATTSTTSHPHKLNKNLN